MVMHVYITPVNRITCPDTARLPSRISSDQENIVENCSELLVPDIFAFLLATDVWRNLLDLWLAKQMGAS